jgi:hypothetical protein
MSASYEIDYSPKVNNHSTIAYRKVSPQGTSTGITLSAAGVVGPLEFIIPPSVFRPNKSRLNFQLAFADPGATVTIAWLNANALTLFNRVVLYDSATNAVLCDVSNFSQYASLVVPSGTSFGDFMTKSSQGNAGVLGMTGASANSTPFPYEDICKSNSLINYAFGGTNLAATTGVNAYTGRRQVYAGQDTEATFIDFSIPFSAFKHTFLSVDKNVMSPSNLVLQLYIAGTDNFAWISTSITNPSTGAASLTTAVTLNNVSMLLANEASLTLINDIQSKVMSSGLSMNIAYPTVTRQSISSSTAHSYSLQLTRAYGNRILFVITAPFSAAAGVNLRNDHPRGNLTTYNTFLNNIAVLSQAGIDCTKGEDYMLANREFVKRSAIQNLGEYQLAEFIHVDSWIGSVPLADVDQTVEDGLDVSATASTWQVQANLSTATALNWVSVIIGQKTATFTSGGVIVQ